MRGQAGWKVSGVTLASATGSRPLSFEGMQVLSLNECQRVVSQVPFIPSSQLPGLGHGGPMLQTPGVVQTHAKTAARPVGIPPLHPGGLGIVAPFGCVSAAAGAETSAEKRSGARPRITLRTGLIGRT